MATVFTVAGPFVIPTTSGKGGRTISDEDLKRFWAEKDAPAKKTGCYVFGLRAGKGMRPWYVGKATKNFKQEAFADHKLTRYQRALAMTGKGTPIMFFLVATAKKGAPNGRHIGQLEKFLISVAQAANPQLLNVKGTKEPDWSIPGVLRGRTGKPSSSARVFKSLMKFKP